MSYIWIDQLKLIAREKCKTKLMSEIMMLVVVVSYIWIDKLIRIAREKCKTKLLFEIMIWWWLCLIFGLTS